MHQMLELLYRLERKFVAVAIAIMGVSVFLDVVHRTATRERSLLASITMSVLFGGLVFLGVRARRQALGSVQQPPAYRDLLLAAAVVLLGHAALRVFVWLLPSGLVWSQTLGLVLLLWVALVGASMATHEHRHLALDFGSQLWPKRALPYVHGIGNIVTALFCVALALLSVLSLKDHYGDFADTAGAGGDFSALKLPKFIAYAVLPVSLLTMALRFVLQAIAGLKGHEENNDDDTLRMLGLKDDVPATDATNTSSRSTT